MRIQKAIFSCSEPPAYSSYWNTQSRLYSEGLGIEPVCLLFGKKENTDMLEDYGTVIEREIQPGLPWALQMTLAKFEYTRNEPDTTWITGDMDLLPLSKAHFTSNLEEVPDNYYLCLNHDGISNPRIGCADGFTRLGSERHGKDGRFIGVDIPAHYHVARGAIFESLYFKNMTLLETVKMIVDSDRFGMGVMSDWDKKLKLGKDEYWYYWVAEENYTSFTLYNAIKAGLQTYRGFSYHNTNQRIFAWDKNKEDYIYSPDAVRAKNIVDAHCSQIRPYALQKDAFERIIRLSGLIEI